GTLLLVTHDRWLMERVTDDQYALIGGKLRHCPRGVDQFFELVEEAHCQEERVTSNSSDAAADTAGAAHNEQSDAGTVSDSDSGLSNKERREYKKRFDAVQRRLEKLREEPGRLDRELAQHDPTDYQGLLDIQNEKAAVDSEIASLEDEWLELADLLGIE
ncbi:MAG: ABC transporter ATP-binding protein, partial [Olegusella sp.]|nr:ABC transporter ATP-binding protein [Olegusella sp.]